MEFMWLTLNCKVAVHNKISQLSTLGLLNYAVSTLRTLKDFHVKFRDRYKYVDEILGTEREVKFSLKQTVSDMLLNQCPLNAGSRPGRKDGGRQHP